MTTELLILTPAAFAAALEPLKHHKTRTGMPTEIVTLETIVGGYRGRDEAEQVKRCIADKVRTSGVHYVMLVGDGDRFPMRFTITDRKDANAFNTAFYSADLYYADLFEPDGSFETWDFTGDGYFGELHGESLTDQVNVDRVDLRPDVAVGRVPASSLADVERYVAKVIAYELEAYGKPWPKRALLLAADWPSVDIACTTQEAVAGALKGYQVQKAYLLGNTCLSTPAPSAAVVNKALDDGVGFVAYVGHGNASAWGSVYSTTDLKSAANAKHPTVAFAVACDTAAFATQPPYHPYTDTAGVHHQGAAHGEVFSARPPQPACRQVADDPDSMAEAFLTSDTNGAVGYIACITGAQQTGVDLLKFFAEAMPGQFATLGAAWNYMLNRYYQVHVMPLVISPADWTKLAEVHQPWKFHLFGDPSLRLAGVSSIQKVDFLGTYDIDHDGWKGTLVLEPAPDAYIEQAPNITGRYVGIDGLTHKVRGSVRTWANPLPAAWGPDHQIMFWIDFSDSFDLDDDQKFQGYLNTGDHGTIAGTTWWRDIPFGFVAKKRSPRVVAVDDLSRFRDLRVVLAPGDAVFAPIR